jgi:hypothetical protein
MAKRKKTDIVGLKLRLRESLRGRVESAAKGQERSLNSEVVARLEESFAKDRWREERQEVMGILKDLERSVLATAIALKGFREEVGAPLMRLLKAVEGRQARDQQSEEPELPLPVRAKTITRRQELAARYDVARDDQTPSPLQPREPKGSKS